MYTNENYLSLAYFKKYVFFFLYFFHQLFLICKGNVEFLLCNVFDFRGFSPFFGFGNASPAPGLMRRRWRQTGGERMRKIPERVGNVAPTPPPPRQKPPLAPSLLAAYRGEVKPLSSCWRHLTKILPAAAPKKWRPGQTFSSTLSLSLSTHPAGKLEKAAWRKRNPRSALSPRRPKYSAPPRIFSSSLSDTEGNQNRSAAQRSINGKSRDRQSAPSIPWRAPSPNKLAQRTCRY